MNDITTFSKKIQFNSNNNKFIISLKSIMKNNEKKLEIKLTIIAINNITHYYYEKTLKEIYNEYNFLTEFPTIESLCNYFSKVIMENSFNINNMHNIIYKIIINDKSKNRIIKILLERKINNINEKDIEEIKNGMKSMYRNIETLEEQLYKKNLEYIELEDKYNKLCQKYNEIEQRKNTNSNPINNNSENSNEHSINDLKILKRVSMNSSNNEFNDNIKDYNKDNLIKRGNSAINIPSTSHSYSVYKSISINCNNDSKIASINQSNLNEISKSENIIIYKENNCEINFSKNPVFIEQKYIINDNPENEKDEIESFIAITNKNNNAIISWITKKDNKSIYIKRWRKSKEEITKESKKENAHDSKINSIKYYYNDNVEEKNDYIISLSINDNKTLKIWNIEIEDDINLILVNIIEKKIVCFCLFSCNKFSFDSYLMAYIKDNDKKIISCWKLDNDFNILEQEEGWPKEFTSSSEINYLDCFYYKKDNEVYLINCNNNDVNVIYQPFIDNGNDNNKIRTFKDSIFHLSAFMIEGENNLELFEANCNGVIIWDYNNNDSPKNKFNYGPAFDICLWDKNFLWASTSIGFILIDINEGKKIKTIDENDTKKRNGSKIRKIVAGYEYESIVGINSERKLCLWT